MLLIFPRDPNQKLGDVYQFQVSIRQNERAVQSDPQQVVAVSEPFVKLLLFAPKVHGD